MLQNLSRYYHTIKHLKPIQIRYQAWYRLRNRFFPVKLPAIVETPNYQSIKLETFPGEKVSYHGKNKFRFLNLDQDFKDSINWNHPGHGKLWAYKLNYFEFLNQPELDFDTGQQLIRDYNSKIETSTEGLEPYPISLRGINWIKFMALHSRFPDEIIRSLFAQYRVLMNKIEYHLLGNHLLENGFSLLFGAIFYRDENMYRLAKKIITEQLEEQVLQDGAHFELSPMYHAIIFQRVLDSINLLKSNAHDETELMDLLCEKAALMGGWLRNMQLFDGSYPSVNDTVVGEFIHPEALLEYAGSLGITAETVPLGTCGYRKINYRGFELLADVGEIGPSYIPGHTHADTLSFILHHEGSPVIIDRGVSTYEKTALRSEERSTAAHNTVMVNGIEQSDMWGGFRVGKRASCRVLADNEHLLEAQHDGFQKQGFIHTRKWRAENGKIIIEDRVHGEGASSTAHLHFSPQIKLKETASNTYTANGLSISIQGQQQIEQKRYMKAAGFNKRIEAEKLKIHFSNQLTIIISAP